MDEKNPPEPLLNNPAEPNYLRQKEEPHHRVIAYLRAQGRKYTEIAEEVGLDPQTVSDICKQPWVRELILSEIEKTGKSKLEALFAIEAMESLNVIVRMRDDKNISPSVRKDCAFGILERHMGKSTQKIEMTTQPKDIEDVEQLQKEIDATQRKLSGS